MSWKIEIVTFMSDFQTSIAAAIGVIVRYMIRKNFSFREAFSGAIVGVSSAYYVAPAIAELYELGPRGLAAVALIIGLVGHDLAVGTVKMARNYASTGKVPTSGGKKDDDARPRD